MTATVYHKPSRWDFWDAVLVGSIAALTIAIVLSVAR